MTRGRRPAFPATWRGEMRREISQFILFLAG